MQRHVGARKETAERREKAEAPWLYFTRMNGFSTIYTDPHARTPEAELRRRRTAGRWLSAIANSETSS